MSILDMFKGRVDGVRMVEVVSQAEEVKLIPLGDVHLGALTCEVDKFYETVQYILQSGSLCVLMGDLMEAASKHSVGAGWAEQTQSPQVQLDALVEVLTPIAPQIVVLLEGN